MSEEQRDVEDTGFTGSPSTSEAPPPEFTMDDLNEERVDQEKLKAAERDLALPVGTYTTVPPFNPTTELDKEGRKQVAFWGEVVTVEEGSGREIRGKTGFRLSWVRVNKVDENKIDTGKPDHKHKLYIQAHRTFCEASGNEAGTPAEVVDFLKNYQVRLRLIRTDDAKNIVVAITPVT